jgi:hypothetical protein
MHRFDRLTLAARMGDSEVNRPLLRPDMSERQASLNRSELAEMLNCGEELRSPTGVVATSKLLQ